MNFARGGGGGCHDHGAPSPAAARTGFFTVGTHLRRFFTVQPLAGAGGQMEMRLIAGILLLVGAAAIIGNAAQTFVVGTAASAVPIVGDALANIVYVCAAIGLIFGIIALLGGVFAITGKNWTIAMVGSVFALISGGFFWIGSIMGLVSLILLIVARSEFPGEQKAPVPTPYPPGYAPPGYPPQPYAQPPPYPPQPYGQPPYSQPPPPQSPPPPQQPPSQP